MKVVIPPDWNGEDWRCVTVQWPDSTYWIAILHGLLSQAMRGRFWDESTGTVADAQQVGQDIWQRNTPLADCDAGSGSETGGVTPEVSVTPCGITITIQEEDVGVAKVYIDYETNELVVVGGQCCEARYPLPSSGIIGSGEGEEPTVIEYPPGVDPPASPEYTACGKAQYFVERLEAIGRAAWDNRVSPFDMAGGIKAENAGYSLSMTAVTSLYIVGLQLTAIESVGDADIFNAEFFDALKCRLETLMASGEAKGLSTSEWNYTIVGWMSAYPFTAGVGFDVVADITVAAWWQTIIQQVLKIERCNQMIAEAIGVVGDCTDCEGGVPIPDPNYDWEMVFDFEANDQGWNMDAGEGDGYTPGLGWQSTGGGACVFTQIDAGQTSGVRAGTLVYAKLEGLLYASDDQCGETNHALWFDGEGGAADIDNIITVDEVSTQAPGGFAVEKHIEVPWSLGLGASLRCYIQGRFDQSAGELFAIQKLTLRGRGDKPVKDPVT